MQPRHVMARAVMASAVMAWAVIVLAAGLAVPARAADSPNACIDLARMSTTRAIDNRTIVVTLRGRDGYRKISLASNCTGLKIQDGFSYATSLSKLCPGDIITVLGGSGDRCGIATIAPLSAAEAKALLAKR
jgi:hypothetical protein